LDLRAKCHPGRTPEHRTCVQRSAHSHAYKYTDTLRYAHPYPNPYANSYPSHLHADQYKSSCVYAYPYTHITTSLFHTDGFSDAYTF
jgi:hypothetical protein